MGRGQVDQDIATALFCLQGCRLDRLVTDRHDGEQRTRSILGMPAAHPATRIGIENGDAVAAGNEFACEHEGRRGLAGAALGVGKRYNWHNLFLLK